MTITARTVTHGAGGPQSGAAEIQPTIAGQVAWGSCFDVTTCIGVSPDDGIAVIPYYTQSTSALAVLDETTGALRTVRGSGPVGFTPDSSTIIAYDWSNDGSTVSLELIDRATLAIHPAALPTRESPAFFVAETGSEVVLTSILGDGPITVLDTATGEMT